MFQTAMRRELTAAARRRVGSDAQRLRRDRRRPDPGAARVLPSPRADRRVARPHRPERSRRPKDEALLETRTSKQQLDDFARARGRLARPSRSARLGAGAARRSSSPQPVRRGRSTAAAAVGDPRDRRGERRADDVDDDGDASTSGSTGCSPTQRDGEVGHVHPLRPRPRRRRRRSRPAPSLDVVEATVQSGARPRPPSSRSATTGPSGRRSTRPDRTSHRRPGAAVHRPLAARRRTPDCSTNSPAASAPASASSTRPSSRLRSRRRRSGDDQADGGPAPHRRRATGSR